MSLKSHVTAMRRALERLSGSPELSKREKLLALSYDAFWLLIAIGVASANGYDLPCYFKTSDLEQAGVDPALAVDGTIRLNEAIYHLTGQPREEWLRAIQELERKGFVKPGMAAAFVANGNTISKEDV